jgi:hypothetical protein
MLILVNLGLGPLTNEKQVTLKKVTEYLEKRKNPYMVQVNRECEEVISLSDVVTEMDADDFWKFCSFLTETLEIKPSSICVAHQVTCLRLDGEQTYKQFPLNMTVKEFVKGSQTRFP